MLIDPRTGQVETVGSLNVARWGHKLVKVGSKVVAMSGRGSSSGYLTSIEEWVPANKTWMMSRLSLNVGRYKFAVLSVPVPASYLCD